MTEFDDTRDAEEAATAGQPDSGQGRPEVDDTLPEEASFPPPAPTKRGVFGPKKVSASAAAAASKPAKPKKERTRPRPLSGLWGGFRNPETRPRYLVWTGVAVLLVATLVIVALGVTSTRWFCAEGCHKVQDDTIIAYEASVHAEISCMACHMPVGASPVTFLIHKAEALGELYLTVTNDFHLPLNPESEYGLTMASEQCTQCHGPNRVTTPSEGILIDHAVHAEKEVTCAICHNRTAHIENFEPTLTDPQTGEPNQKHDDFMVMTACFRCHTQDEPEGELGAPGACEACHPPSFELKPASHLEEGFYPEGHGDLGFAEASRVASATAEESATATAEGEGEEGGHGEAGIGPSLPKLDTINQCSTCHSEKFCSDCHGVPMPHPFDFKESHGEVGDKNPESCTKCHGPADRFCDDCHHGAAMGREVDTTRTWIAQHPDTVRETGASACFQCHNPTYCANCHVSGGQ